jgi:hypothetical protein
MGEVDGNLVKAFIRVLDEKNQNKVEDIPICFNPKEYSLEKGVSYAAGDARTDNQAAEFKGTDAMTMAVNLQFDTYEERSSVRDVYMRRIEQLAMMRKDAKEERDAAKHSPPTVIFVWGKLTFQGVVESLSQKYTMFLSDGTPVRAECSLRIRQTSGAAVDSAAPVTSTQGASAVTAVDVKNSGAAALQNSNIDDPKQLLDTDQQKLGGAATLSARVGPNQGMQFDAQVKGPLGAKLSAAGNLSLPTGPLGRGVVGGLSGGLRGPFATPAMHIQGGMGSRSDVRGGNSGDRVVKAPSRNPAARVGGTSNGGGSTGTGGGGTTGGPGGGGTTHGGGTTGGGGDGTGAGTSSGNSGGGTAAGTRPGRISPPYGSGIPNSSDRPRKAEGSSSHSAGGGHGGGDTGPNAATIGAAVGGGVALAGAGAGIAAGIASRKRAHQEDEKAAMDDSSTKSEANAGKDDPSKKKDSSTA